MTETVDVCSHEERHSFVEGEKNWTKVKMKTAGSQKRWPSNWLNRLKRDTVFRHRFIHTVVLCWSLFSLGWGLSMSGPTFLDIRLILDIDLHTASWYFTTDGLGYFVGSIASGTLYDRYNKILLLMFTTLGRAIATVATPWCSNFFLMMVMRFISGFFAGGLDAGGNADIIHVWGTESGPYMQAFYFIYSVGGILAPLASEPFLVEGSCTETNITIFSVIPNSGDSYFHETKALDNISDPAVGNWSTCIVSYGETNVYYAFVLSGLLFLSAAVLLFVLFIWTRPKAPYVASKTEKEARTESQAKELTIKLKVTFVFLLACLFMSYCVCEDSLFYFLTTFCVSYMNWSKANGSYLTAVGWCTLAAGRLLGIVVVHYCSDGMMLFVSLTVTTGSFAGMLVASIFHIGSLLWASVAIAGFFMAVVYPCVMTWTSRNILKVTGKISAIFLTVGSVGATVFPLLFGYLMDTVSPIWFVILLLIMSGITLSLFLTVVCLKRMLIKGEVNLEIEGSVLKEMNPKDHSSTN